jgi:hypothetical protein
MKVKELIEQLKQLDENAEISVLHEKMPDDYEVVAAEQHKLNEATIYIK